VTTHSSHLPYRAWLRSRWPTRSRSLGRYAVGGSLALLAFDVAFTRALAAPPGLATIAALRLPWIALPLAGMAAASARPGARWLPAAVLALSLAWTWGNDWTYCALGLGGEPIQSLAVVLSALTAAIFLPLTPLHRVAVFASMWLGHLAIDLACGSPRPLGARLWTDAAILALVACLTVLHEQFALSRRRSVILRRRLERTVAALEASQARASAAAAEVSRMAAEVAHKVNNPLAAVKVNVALLGQPPLPDEPEGERAEMAGETLEAVERIARIVAALRRQATQEPDPPPPPRAPGPPDGV
jgi:signal transduction histidine kinase